MSRTLNLIGLGLIGAALGLLCFYFGVRFAAYSLEPVSTVTVDLSECSFQLPTLD